jgi:hypothetical protein
MLLMNLILNTGNLPIDIQHYIDIIRYNLKKEVR